METVSVDEALSRGKRLINVAVYFIMFGPTIISLIIVMLLHVDGWIIFIAFCVGFPLAWLYWSIMITRWRLWAFDNVRNVHELKKRAIKEKLIWPDGSFYERTEIRSAADKEKWAALQAKFKRADIFNDDFTVGNQTLIFFSKAKSIGAFVLGLVMICAAIFLYTDDGKLWVPCIALAGGLYVLITGGKNMRNSKPQLIISNEGIATAKHELCTWAEIYNEDTIIEGSGKSATAYLRYQLPTGRVNVEIAELDVSKSKLDSLLRLYRGRYEQKIKKQQAITNTNNL